MFPRGLRMFTIAVLVLGVYSIAVAAPLGAASPKTRKVRVPLEDRFTPFALTIHVGDSVKWVNQDADDHTVVSDDFFTTAGHHNTNHLLSANGGKFTLQFDQPGTFVYYCRFHAALDASHQPIAPGPYGGIQDTAGNFGTPMMGVITVLP